VNCERRLRIYNRNALAANAFRLNIKRETLNEESGHVGLKFVVLVRTTLRGLQTVLRNVDVQAAITVQYSRIFVAATATAGQVERCAGHVREVAYLLQQIANMMLATQRAGKSPASYALATRKLV